MLVTDPPSPVGLSCQQRLHLLPSPRAVPGPGSDVAGRIDVMEASSCQRFFGESGLNMGKSLVCVAIFFDAFSSFLGYVLQRHFKIPAVPRALHRRCDLAGLARMFRGSRFSNRLTRRNQPCKLGPRAELPGSPTKSCSDLAEALSPFSESAFILHVSGPISVQLGNPLDSAGRAAVMGTAKG